MIFVNFKTYEEGTGKRAIKLAKICQEVSQKSKISITACVQAVDIFRLSSHGFKIWAQHIDDIDFGPNTGQILPWAVVGTGAGGTLLNHSECKLPVEVIGSVIKRVKEQESKRAEGFKVLVCAESVEEGKEIAQFKPDLIAYEPPEFIGSRTVSVSMAKPKVIRDFVKEIKDVPILVGAGVHSREDVKIALELGAVGILVATDVVKAKDPRKELEDFAKGFKTKELKE